MFLDADTVDIGDIHLNEIEQLGDLVKFPVTHPSEVVERVQDVEVVLTNKVVLGRPELEAAKHLRLVCACATGVNHLDLGAAADLGIGISNVAGYSTVAVVQHTMALILNLATKVHRYSAEIERWPESPIFCRLDHPVIELSGKRLGLAGTGEIGSGVGRAAEALGMEVVAWAREGAVGATTQGWERLRKREFFASCDVVSLHCPLNIETERMINEETLGWMKESAFLINTGRGGLVVEEALAASLREGSIGGAGLDVLSIEPPPVDHPLLASDLENLLITPHSAWAAEASRQRLPSCREMRREERRRR